MYPKVASSHVNSCWTIFWLLSVTSIPNPITIYSRSAHVTIHFWRSDVINSCLSCNKWLRAQKVMKSICKNALNFSSKFFWIMIQIPSVWGFVSRNKCSWIRMNKLKLLPYCTGIGIYSMHTANLIHCNIRIYLAFFDIIRWLVNRIIYHMPIIGIDYAICIDWILALIDYILYFYWKRSKIS